MAWIEGSLVSNHSSSHYQVQRGAGRHDINPEQPVEMWRQGEWQRGEVQFREHQRYCWTDGRALQRLEDGAKVRVWAGREVPPPRAEDLQHSHHLRTHDLSR